MLMPCPSVMLACAALPATYCGLPRIGVQCSAQHALPDASGSLPCSCGVGASMPCNPEPGSPSPTYPNTCAFEVSTFHIACCASMQSLRSSAVRAFGSVAKGHGAHDIKNPTADVTISLVLGKHSCCTGFERSACLFSVVANVRESLDLA